MTTYPAIVAKGRAWAESRMGAENGGSTVAIRRRTGETQQNETTGREEPTWSTVYADLPARIAGSPNAGASRTTDVAGVEVEIGARELHVSATAVGIADGDYVDITAGESAGSAWRIVESDFQDQATARRLPILAVQHPSEWAT